MKYNWLCSQFVDLLLISSICLRACLNVRLYHALHDLHESTWIIVYGIVAVITGGATNKAK